MEPDYKAPFVCICVGGHGSYRVPLGIKDTEPLGVFGLQVRHDVESERQLNRQAVVPALPLLPLSLAFMDRKGVVQMVTSPSR